MLTCKQLVARSSDLLDAQLSLRERLAVHTHLAMCSNCRRFLRQMKVTQRVLRQWPDREITELDVLAARLAKAAKEQQYQGYNRATGAMPVALTML